YTLSSIAIKHIIEHGNNKEYNNHPGKKKDNMYLIVYTLLTFKPDCNKQVSFCSLDKATTEENIELNSFIKTWQTYKSCANIRTMYCTMKREETCRETTR
ncbi:hypothetical protein, partial [Bartonella grahamii]|uniref:hypothetical protein n=1 Tax=Bartonella grahamii TaxID=33045 RepID=UPI001ABA8F92